MPLNPAQYVITVSEDIELLIESNQITSRIVELIRKDGHLYIKDSIEGNDR